MSGGGPRNSASWARQSGLSAAAWRVVAALGAGCCALGCGSGAVPGPGGEVTPITEGPAYTFSTGSFPVAAGTELTQCYYAPAPADVDIAVTRFTATMRHGSHHFNFFYLPPSVNHPPEGLGDCTEALRISLAGSQWDSIDQALPDGTALKIPRGSWIALESHFVNATDAEQQGGVDVTVHTVDATRVKDWVGIFFNLMDRIKVPPRTEQVLRGRCAGYLGANVFSLTSHMHHFGSTFEINLYDFDKQTSTSLYTNRDYEHPRVDNYYTDPIHLGPNQGFEWKCHYKNDRTSPLVGGDSALDNEMCIMVAFYYPSMSDDPYCFTNAAVDSVGP